ncbi:MAG: AI-2E family transporter [Clostridia bacterium]|nr:AI-2E family transporter [Clostridia bacterium]
MEHTHAAHRWRLPVAILLALTAAVVLRHVWFALLVQLAAAGLLTLLALPICRALEKRMASSAAAVLSLLLLGAAAVTALVLLVPPIVRQVQQLTAAFPSLLAWIQAQWQNIAAWLSARGIDISPMRDGLFGQITEQLGNIVSRLMAAIGQVVGGFGKVMLAPLLAFYLLRDRKRIASGMTLLLPVKHRSRGVRAVREMRRETAAYMRGQLLLSVSVGLLTAVGLLLTGTPGWLLLGVLMGVLELVPYVGPVIAGVPAVLLSLQNGVVPALWTMGVLVAVQQVEGAVLSPRLLGGATQLHPMAVLLMVSAGGIAAGPWGMVLVIPLVVSLRGALRGWRD